MKHFPVIRALVTRYRPVLQGDNRWACHVLEFNRIRRGLSGIIRQEVYTNVTLDEPDLYAMRHIPQHSARCVALAITHLEVSAVG
jgi:hypothetical protein